MQKYNLNPLQRSYNFKDLQLRDGIKKDGVTYSKFPSANNGMTELVNIVAGLQKDVKRINECLTLPGAQTYARRQGVNWEAHELDFTGPNGKPDGIKEVIVTDSKGNIKVVNGYALTNTTYPIRKMYRILHPSKQSRKAEPFSKFKQNIYDLPDVWDGKTQPTYKVQIPEDDEFYQFRNNTPISVKKVFKKYIFDEVYNGAKPDIDRQGLMPMFKAQLANKVLTKSFNTIIKYPAMSKLFGIDKNEIDNIPTKEFNKMLRNKDLIAAMQEEMSHIVTNAELRNDAQSFIYGEVIPESIIEVQQAQRKYLETHGQPSNQEEEEE